MLSPEMLPRTSVDPLLETKLHPPRGFVDVLDRPHLLARLNNGLRVPLTLISAPAGFGKTTLARQWLEHLSRRKGKPIGCAWLSLDRHDSDPSWFLAYVVAALRTLAPGACANTLECLNAQVLPPVDALVGYFVSDLESLADRMAAEGGDGYVLVLDDYAAASSAAVDSLLHAVLLHPPRGFHLIIVTRQDPALGLSRLRTRRQLIELRSRDLRLNAEESAALLTRSLTIPLTDDEVGMLIEQSEGWPAALHLAAIVLRDAVDPRQALADMQVSPGYAMAYLLEEVLAQQPPEMQECLVKTAILDRFGASLCAAVCDQTAARGDEFLERLQSLNLFLVGLDPEGMWYRYHHLFRQLLQRQLRQRHSAAEIEDLHRRASAWFAGHGLLEEALDHALAAHDTGAAVSVLVRHRYDLMNYEQWRRLEQCLRLLPAEAWESPHVLMSEVWLTQSRRADIATMVQLGERARARIQELALPPDQALALLGELDTLATLAHYYASDAEKSIQTGRQALERLPLDAYTVRVHARVHLAAAYHMAGDRDTAYTVMAEGIHGVGDASDLDRRRMRLAWGFLEWLDGDLNGLALTAAQSVDDAQDAVRGESLNWARYFRACVAYQRNDLGAAEAEARAILEDPLGASSALALVHSAAILALTCEALGRSTEAQQIVETAMTRVLEMRNSRLLAVLQALQAELALRQGDTVTAARWAVGTSMALGVMPLFYANHLVLPKEFLAQNTAYSRRQARALLPRFLDMAVATHNVPIHIQVLALQALLADAEGDETAALATLEEAVRLAQPGGFLRVFADLGPAMASLLQRLKGQTAVPAFVARIEEACVLLPHARPRTSESKGNARLIEPLTEREMEILALLAERLSNREIGERLFIAPPTVKRHTVNIYQKLLVSGRREAVAKATTLGILSQS
ncbi:MAG: LuxR C-terminal-related transcriptional regulator [Anaerolineae bacterium]